MDKVEAQRVLAERHVAFAKQRVEDRAEDFEDARLQLKEAEKELAYWANVRSVMQKA